MKKLLSLTLAFAAIAVIATGCNDSKSGGNGSNAGTGQKDDGHDDGHEDHADHGHNAPHGGHLIDLGRNHEYHAELLNDRKTETLTIYVMDTDMKPVKLEQASISLVMTVGDKTSTYELTGNDKSSSSEFSSKDKDLLSALTTDGAKGKLRATIKGTPFSGSFDYHGDADSGHFH